MEFHGQINQFTVGYSTNSYQNRYEIGGYGPQIDQGKSIISECDSTKSSKYEYGVKFFV